MKSKIIKPDYSKFAFHFNDVILNNNAKVDLMLDLKIVSGNLVIDMFKTPQKKWFMRWKK